ncbi:MAG: ComEC/Rec2 family competence protein [bacterium]
MRRIPLVPLAVAMIVGIAMAHWIPTLRLGYWLALLAIGATVGGLLWMLAPKKTTLAIPAALILTFLTLGGLLDRFSDPIYDARHWTHLCNQPSHIVLRLTESPVPRERSWKATAEVERVDGNASRGTLQLYLRRDSTASSLRYGDLLLVHGYADTTKGWLYTTDDHYLLTRRNSTSLRAHAERLRMRLLRRMQVGPLERRSAGVVEAMTLGWRGDLDKELQTQFRESGILHLLCVSGLHVGLLAAMVGWLMIWVGRERRGRIIKGSVQLLAVWGFALLTGLAPATMRAALMFSFFIVSNMLARRTDSLNLLAAAAIVMLMANPMLLFNTGWQLSFSAVAGILLMRPIIRLQHNFLWQSAMVCIAATLATLPVTLATFHQFQPYFLIANVIIVPAAALILALSLLYLALPCAVTAWPLEWLLKGCDWLTHGISQLPGATVDNIFLGTTGTVATTLAVILTFLTINIALTRYIKYKNTTEC